MPGHSPPTANVPGQQQGQPSPFRQLLDFAQKGILIYFAMQFASQIFGSNPRQGTEAPPTPSAASQSDNGATTGLNVPPTKDILPAWPLASEVELHFYMSTSPYPYYVFTEEGKKEHLPRHIWDNITLGDWKDDSRIAQYTVDVPLSVQKNASTLFGHIFLIKGHISPNPSDPSFDPHSVHHLSKVLLRYLPKPRVRKEKNLLGSHHNEDLNSLAHEEVIPPDIIVPYWHPNLTLAIVSDNVAIPYQKLPPIVSQYISLVPDSRNYFPIIFPNDFWHLRSQFIEVNSTTLALPLQITFNPISYMKFQLYSTLTASFEEAAKNGQGVATAELDEIKRMLVETNPFLLILTAVVSILHMVFEMLAFSSDVSHWRNKKELTGVSVRTIVTNVFVQLVILLYLLDNNAETSWMILMGQGMGMLIEAWKVTKAVDIQFLPSQTGSILPYRLCIQDKHILSEDERKTQQYDREAFRYVSYVAIPLLASYTVYSLIYETHRGWYSFTISTLTSFVYMFGFAQLIPQLIINYKLKSVAHMPMKAMVFKTLSTVVDDFFAFCIKMPILHRLACFRDDVVFLIFLYQRWIYKVDPNRVNEFGQIMTSDEKAAMESKKEK